MSERETRAKRRRREHSPALKRELIARSLQPGASVSAIALENGINANLLFKWRRMHLRAAECVAPLAPANSAAVLLPVTIQAPPTKVVAAPSPRQSTGVIEIDIGGSRVRLRGTVDEASVRCVLQALRELA
jgi:transposase